MKNFTQKFIGIFALVFATSFTVNAQCDETLVLTSQGGNGGGSYGNWAWFAGDLRLWLEEGDVVYAANGTGYTIAGEMAGHYYTNGISQVLFTSNVAGVFTNGNSYNTNIASCTIEGCTESTAQNYMPNANTDDGSCIVFGCMDESASNFNSIATNEDESCLYPGCTDPNYLEYDENANTDDGSCSCVGSVEISVTTTSEEPFEAVASVVGDYSSAATLTGYDIFMLSYVAGPYLYECMYMGGEGPYCDYAAEMINSVLVIGDDFIWSYQDSIISTSDEVIISTPGEYTLSPLGYFCTIDKESFPVGIFIPRSHAKSDTDSTASYNLAFSPSFFAGHIQLAERETDFRLSFNGAKIIFVKDSAIASFDPATGSINDGIGACPIAVAIPDFPK